MNELNLQVIKPIQGLIDESINVKRREVKITVSELDESNSEKITIATNLSLIQVLGVIKKRVKDQADRLLIMQKSKELTDELLKFKKLAEQMTEYAFVSLTEMAEVKKINDSLMAEIKAARGEYLEFREKMIKKYEDDHKTNNESEGLNNG